ncbi:polymorphic toxin type 47 domain-containing protein [uncultured Chryseobacterium sp.]|uniref:polymorphic toxin type 47 domain-containing protein n=1 Tax=uncultured Chryseobacterium sp. TaxID=259322 RepID=UPI0025D8BB58|nr:polymorphic toxin type 47 domain-containing protein [uncultured Chryseobacterium sp.]
MHAAIGAALLMTPMRGEGKGLTGNNWEFNSIKDVDMRGGATHLEALEEAFKRTGVPKELFKVTKWGKDINGKSVPVEYVGPGGANVNMDIPAWNNLKKSTGKLGEGPHQPHIGYQTSGRGVNRVRGHIFRDNVPATR